MDLVSHLQAGFAVLVYFDSGLLHACVALRYVVCVLLLVVCEDAVGRLEEAGEGCDLRDAYSLYTVPRSLQRQRW